jgi:hypothetical protein
MTRVMPTNRSMPPGPVIPELPYADVPVAARWLCSAFGFRERLRIGSHRIQLHVGAGAIVVVEGSAIPDASGCRVMVPVADADAHHAKAVAAGVRILGETDHISVWRATVFGPGRGRASLDLLAVSGGQRSGFVGRGVGQPLACGRFVWPKQSMKATPKELTQSLPLVSTFRFAHLCRSRPAAPFTSRLAPLRCKLTHSLQLMGPSACLSMSHRFPRAPFSVFAAVLKRGLSLFPVAMWSWLVARSRRGK